MATFFFAWKGVCVKKNIKRGNCREKDLSFDRIKYFYYYNKGDIK